MSDFVSVRQGESPLILSFPHTGTDIPADIEAHLADPDLARQDTDWWIDRLYEPLVDMFNATTVRTAISRTVIDVNRDPFGASLYPGQATTGLCPTTTFDGVPIYEPGEEPDDDEIERRRAFYFRPYYMALGDAVAETCRRHGWCVLYDCHSIRSEVPRLFPGRLPILNLGTNDGAACAPSIASIAMEFAESSPFAAVLDGHFKGGWITRTYGRPRRHVHAIQMEIAQRAYLREERAPWEFDERKAERLRRWLRDIIQAICDEAREIEEGI
jgi:N-formylglutamate deformylase